MLHQSFQINVARFSSNLIISSQINVELTLPDNFLSDLLMTNILHIHKIGIVMGVT